MRGSTWIWVVLVIGWVMASVGCGKVTTTPTDGGPDAASMTGMTCTPDALSCGSNGALYQCDATGGDLTKIKDCQYGCATDRCKECAANTSFCSSNDYVMCSADGMIVNAMTCQYGCLNNACNTCDPGVAYCDGGNAVKCGANGQPAQTMTCGTAGCLGGVCNTCTPNTTSCQGDTLVACSANGTVASTTNCALGCTGSRCNEMVPLYGVPAPAGTQPNLLVDQNATLDISSCAGATPTASLTVGTTTTTLSAPQVSVLTQLSAPTICIIRFGTITTNASTTLTVVNNNNVLSLLATGDITIGGLITGTNNASGPKPGETVPPYGKNANGRYKAPGPGGGGGARAGGAGGACLACNNGADVAGGTAGAPVTNIQTRLNGGSSGGGVYSAGLSLVLGFGGRGGGALHLVSLKRVSVGATGGLAMNGLGGRGIGSGQFTSATYDLPAGGGGAGGTIVIEAPVINLSSGALAAANGGGGAGGCYGVDQDLFWYFHYNGEGGQLSDVRAAGGDCPNTTNGDGGYEANGTASPSADGAPSDSGAETQAGGGGGGSSGFIILRARSTSAVMLTSGAVVSPQATVGTVNTN